MPDFDPVTRKEKYLSAIAADGRSGELPDPVTREEMYLNEIAQGGGGGTGGTTNYNALSNKPKINGVELSGDKTLEDFGLEDSSDIINHTYQGKDLTVVHADEISEFSDVWAWIKTRIREQNWSKIHVGDYIPFQCTNGTQVNAQIAGIDTYYNYGNTAVGHHIDFISRELWPQTVQYNKVNFNNGVSNEVPTPWMSSNVYAYLNSLKMEVPNSTTVPVEMEEVDYTADGVYFYLPTTLKDVINTKLMLLPTRYNNTDSLATNNSWEWKSMGNLWLPLEFEIAGSVIWGGSGYAVGSSIQYPIFANNMNRVKVREGYLHRENWWTSSSHSGNAQLCVNVGSSGIINYGNASNFYSVPICFRISE